MLTRRGLAIRKSSLSEKNIQKIKRDLVVVPESNEYQQSIPYKIYSESENYIITPRHYYSREIVFEPSPSNLSNGAPIECAFNGTLNVATSQPEASDAVYEGLQQHGAGILNLPTGYGKTTVALHIVSRIKRRTLIVVHKEFLMNQWVEKIQHFLPNLRLGKIQGAVVDVEDKDIVIGMLQSLSKKEYDKDVFKDFGLTIIDEVHHVCTRTFSKFLMKQNTTFLLGLSATIERKDGLTYVLHWFLGNTLFKKERVNERAVKVHKIVIDGYEDPFPTNRMKKPNFPEAVNVVVSSLSRNERIMDIVSESLKESRRIIILTDRRAHCESLHDLMTQKGISVGLYLGGMKQAELSKSEKCDVLIGTFALANEGLDIPILDTLVLASPKSDVVQSVGRILRETKGKKNTPIVYDIVDNWGSFKHQFYKRNKFYKASGFHIFTEKSPTDFAEPMFLDDVA